MHYGTAHNANGVRLTPSTKDEWVLPFISIIGLIKLLWKDREMTSKLKEKMVWRNIRRTQYLFETTASAEDLALGHVLSSEALHVIKPWRKHGQTKSGVKHGGVAWAKFQAEAVVSKTAKVFPESNLVTRTPVITTAKDSNSDSDSAIITPPQHWGLVTRTLIFYLDSNWFKIHSSKQCNLLQIHP